MKKLKGHKISPGVSIGPVYYVERTNYLVPRTYIKNDEIPLEILKFRKAIGKAITELTELKSLLKGKLRDDQLQLIDSQLVAMADEEMIKEVFRRIRKSKKNIAWVYHEIMTEYENMLKNTGSLYQSERVIDINDIKRRVLHHLIFNEKYNLPKIQTPSIVICERMSPSDLIHLHDQDILGVITRYGGFDSHTGILARALNIPYISGVDIDKINENSNVILDADNEQVIIDPDPILEHEYQERRKKFITKIKYFRVEGEEHKTKDGKQIDIYVNAGFFEEVKLINISSVKGIGLFRTEYICFEKNAIPDEDEQFELYTKVLLHMKGKPVAFRVFDFGRDKILDILDITALKGMEVLEDVGGVRFMLENPSLLVTQFRSFIRASKNGEIRILLPLVSKVEEIDASIKLFRKVMNETDCKSLGCRTDIPIGAMVETKTAIENLEEIAKRVDFMSIGTNDLAVYLLGKGRDEYMIKNHYHPEMFRAIKKVVEVGKTHKKPVYVCGEMAADPISLIGLIAIGIDSISVNLSAFKTVVDLISRISFKEVRKMEKLVLSETNILSLYKILKAKYDEIMSN